MILINIIFSFPDSESLDIQPSSSDNLTVATNTIPADDPPLETLRREPSGSVSNLLPQGAGSEADLLSGLLGTGGDSPLAGLMGAGPGVGADQRPGTCTDIVWVLLAVAVRLVLDTEYSGLIGGNILAPFLLTLTSLYMLGYVSTSQSTVSSLLSAGT